MSEKWLIASGSSLHMCSNSEYFVNLTKDHIILTVFVGDGKRSKIEGVGDIVCAVVLNGSPKSVKLQNFLYVPGLD